MVERTQTKTKVAAPEGTLVTEAQIDVVLASETAFISIPVQNPTQASQDIPATPTIANTLLLTTGLKFDRTTTEVASESTKSSAAHTEKLPSKEPSRTNEDVLHNAVEVQMDLILAN